MAVTQTQNQVDSEGPFGDAGGGQVSARAVVNEMVEAGLFDDVMGRIDAGGLQLTGEGGFLPEMVKAVLEAGLEAELTDHLGYEQGDPAGRGVGELPQRDDAEDGGDRGRRRRAGHAAGPGRHVRAAAGAQGRAPARRAGGA